MLTILRGECLISWAPALLTNTPGLPLKAFQICVFWGGIRFDLSPSLLISMHTLVTFMDKDLVIEATGEYVGPQRLSLLSASYSTTGSCHVLSQDLQKLNGLSFKKINWTDLFMI